MLEACGLKGHAIGGALISPMHANFIENAGGATTADALALMAEARRRAREQFGVELEHEVELLGADLASRRKGRRGGETRHVAGGRGSRNRSRPRARAATLSLPSRAARRAIASSCSGSLPPAALSLLGFLILLTGLGLYAAARTTSAFAVDRIAVQGASPEVAADVRKALAPALGESLLGLDLTS